MADKPAVLIIGGLGYIGRFLALHIEKNNLASEVRLVDKVLPQLAWLAPEFEKACSQDKFMQADASKERESFPTSCRLTSHTDNPVSIRISPPHF
jgi:nucleoside-diphosphate-sugar epimerase